MNTQEIKKFIDHTWDTSIIPTLMEYIHIPNKSPHFDPEWKENGHMDRAVKLIADWCKKQELRKMYLEVVCLTGRTPVIFIDIPGNSDKTILLYGHLDKQPEMSGWDTDLAPWKPVLKEDKLYGRGGADDGYAAFASLTAIKSLQEQNIPHARCVILIEACEESGSYDLPFYIDALATRIGKPELVICLDSGCGNYDQLWVTTSLRGLVGGVLRIEILNQGIHSGYGSGVVPSCFLVLRKILERIEDEQGQVKIEALQVDIPEGRKQQAEQVAEILGDNLYKAYPFVKEVKALSDNTAELILNRTWRAALSVTGIDGVPELANAGNVTLPNLMAKFSMRLPPLCDVQTAAQAIKNIIESEPPFNARVQFDIEDSGAGWNAPAELPWLTSAANEASVEFFGKPAAYMGEGGSIPFMGMLGKKFPESQFLITGLLGPKSNAHGPNEFLHIPTGKKLTACVAKVIAEHYQASRDYVE